MSGECREIEALHTQVVQLARQLVDRCQAEGIPIKIGETYRTKERQDQLYAKGRTQPGPIVTYAKGSSMSSYHQWRLAFDVFINEKGNEYNPKLLARAGKIGEALGLEWGGSWRDFKDTAHFQYTQGLSIEELKQGKTLKEGETKVQIKPIKIRINEQVKEVSSIEEGGNNFVKLQDLRSEEVIVSYDTTHKMPVLQLVRKS